MPTANKDARESTASSLVNDILNDLQRLVEQQFQLTRREIEQEFRLRAQASMIFMLGLGGLLLGGLQFSVAIAHLLHWASSPVATDSAGLPLWACHAIVATFLSVAAAVATIVGRASFRSVSATPNPITEIEKDHAS